MFYKVLLFVKNLALNAFSNKIQRIYFFFKCWLLKLLVLQNVEYLILKKFIRMFKFNFNNKEKLVQSEICIEENSHCYTSKEIEIPPDIEDFVKKLAKHQIISLDYNFGVIFSCLSANEVMNMLKEKSGNKEFLDVLEADKLQSDLLPGKYEGGLKVWECTKDLAIYFMKNVAEVLNENLNEKTVLDLGCGSGLLGIMCLSMGASVTFQDYNQEVLEAMTIPNIFLNCSSLDRKKIKLYSGDWASFLNLMVLRIETEECEDRKFDYILTSETIYHVENYKKIIAIIKKLLKLEGLAFVAAKAHYFGVGGNLKEFDNFLHQEGLQSCICWETKEGVSRGIIEVKLK